VPTPVFEPDITRIRHARRCQNHDWRPAIAAEDALLDRTLITASPEAYQDFVKRLDAKPRPNRRLRKTMQAAAPWVKA
jgi:hypothetical protein